MKKLRRRPLTIEEILAWADLHQHETGRWPTKESGVILGAIGEKWIQIDAALRGVVIGIEKGFSRTSGEGEHVE